MFQLCVVFILVISASAIRAEEVNLGKVGWSGYGTHFRMFSDRKPKLLRPTSRRRSAVRVPNSLYDRLKRGVSMGVLKLRREGDLCLSFRKTFSRCDLALTEDRLILFNRRSNGRLPMRIQLGLSR